jgi:hypothetical protein
MRLIPNELENTMFHMIPMFHGCLSRRSLGEDGSQLGWRGHPENIPWITTFASQTPVFAQGFDLAGCNDGEFILKLWMNDCNPSPI